jgi:integrase
MQEIYHSIQKEIYVMVRMLTLNKNNCYLNIDKLNMCLDKGKPFNDFKKSFATAKDDAGIKDFLFHDLRHCAITNLRKAGNDYSTIMKASGHKAMSMFFRYNLVEEEDVAKMKWKGEEDYDRLESRLKAAGFDPEEIRRVLNQKSKEKGKTGTEIG